MEQMLQNTTGGTSSQLTTRNLTPTLVQVRWNNISIISVLEDRLKQ